MRKRSFATLGILALLAAASAFGQERIRVDIPFEFHFGDKVMPAGQYDVSRNAQDVHDLLSLDCYACRVHVYSITYPTGGSNDASSKDRLVFNKYGETYFLSEVWTSGYLQGGALSKSKTEREIARNIPDMARITLQARSSKVTIARR